MNDPTSVDFLAFLLGLLPKRLRENPLWREELEGGQDAGILPLLDYSLEPFKADLKALKNVWNGNEDPDSSRIILEDRDVDRFITGYLQPWVSSDPHLLNIVLNAIQELKGTTRGLKLLAYILGVSEVEIFDTDSISGDYCPYPEELFHRYGSGGVYRDPSPDASLPDCYPGLRFTDGTWAYGSLDKFSGAMTLYGSNADYGDPIVYGAYLAEGPCTFYGRGDLYGREGLMYCTSCPRDVCIPNCTVILRMQIEPTAYIAPNIMSVFEDIVKRYIPACVNVAKTFWVSKLDDALAPEEDLHVIDGSSVAEGLVYGSGSSYGESGYGGGLVISTSPAVYGYPETYGGGTTYGG